MTATSRTFVGGTSLIVRSLGLAAAGVVLLAIGALTNPRQLFFSYLVAYGYSVSIAVGALIFLMICHAMRAGWPVAVQRLVEAVISVLPLLLLLFLPLVFGLRTLYPWLRPEELTNAEEKALLLHKAPYLNLPFFLGRTVVFYAIWLVTESLLRAWSLRKDSEPGAPVNGKLYVFSAAMLPAVALAMSFAAFDWLMSLTPMWFSTMYPVYYFGGGFLAAIAAVTVLTYAAQRADLLTVINPSHYYALGRLLLAFTIFWAYCAFFQFMLIWMANRPDEASFYFVRMHGSWGTMTLLLVFAQFVIPFFVLLNYRIKRRGGWLAVLSVWVLVVHYLDLHWLVMPAARSTGFPLHYLDLGALLTFAGLLVAFGAYRLRGRHMLPINDPRLPDALRYESS